MRRITQRTTQMVSNIQYGMSMKNWNQLKFRVLYVPLIYFVLQIKFRHIWLKWQKGKSAAEQMDELNDDSQQLK